MGAIAMRPIVNEQGGHCFMSLKTGHLLNLHNTTPLPMPSEVIDHVHRIEHRAPVGITFADINNVAFLDISDDDEVVDVSDSESDNSENDDDPYDAADPEVEDPEDSVEITEVDEQESEHAGVVTREPKIEGVGGDSEELETPGVAEPTGAVIFDEKLDEIMDVPIDEPTVPPTLPDPLPTVPTQHKGRYMRPQRKTSYSHLGKNDEGYSNAVITIASDQSYATAICHLESMALINDAKGFGNATNVLTSYSLAINAII